MSVRTSERTIVVGPKIGRISRLTSAHPGAKHLLSYGRILRLPEAILSLVLEKQCSYTKYDLGKIECYSLFNSWKMYVVSAVAVEQSRQSDPRHSMTKIQVGGLHATIICLKAMRLSLIYLQRRPLRASSILRADSPALYPPFDTQMALPSPSSTFSSTSGWGHGQWCGKCTHARVPGQR